MKKITLNQQTMNTRNAGIISLYKSGQYTTEQIAKNFSISPRRVQSIAKRAGVIRTQAEANRIAAPLKNYHTIPIELRKKRTQITHSLRYRLIQDHPYCANCGQRPDEGIRLEVDHIDEDATNNEVSNLQVLCSRCNYGKSHLARFGSSS